MACLHLTIINDASPAVAGRCDKGLAGGIPTKWFCGQCEQNTDRIAGKLKPVVRQPVVRQRTQINVSKGAAGLSKWLLRMDRSNAKLAVERLKICSGCEHKNNGVVGTCKLCGCVLRAKIQIKGEKCPAGKW